jgi:hypothetical protein
MENQNTKIATLRRFVDGFNDQQHLRIIAGNRLVAQFRERLGVLYDGKPAEEGEEEKRENAEKAIKLLKDQYHRYTDGVVKSLQDGEVGKLKRKIVLEEGGVFSDVSELYLVDSYMSMVRLEEQLKRRLEKLMDGIPVYDQFLSQIKGVGPISSAYMLAYLNPHKAKYPSSFWKYCGLDVAQDGRGRGRYKEHLVPHTMLKGDGSTVDFMGLSFQAQLKPKLYLLATSFVKHKGSKYNEVYYNYKNRLTNRADLIPIESDESGVVTDVTTTYGPVLNKHMVEITTKSDTVIYVLHTKSDVECRFTAGDSVKKGQLLSGKTKAHINAMALRYVAKIFLVDLHAKWRELEGLPVPAPYSEAKLGLHHGVDQ